MTTTVSATLAAGAIGLLLGGAGTIVVSAQSGTMAQPAKPQTPATPTPVPPPADMGAMQGTATPEGTPVKQVTVPPALKSRVDAYWASRMQMNLAGAYKFYDANFRTAYSEQQFLQNFQRLLRFRPEYLGIDSVSLYPSGTVANVGVKLRTKPAELQGMELVSVSYERWQKNGATWFKQGEPIMPTP